MKTLSSLKNLPFIRIFTYVVPVLILLIVVNFLLIPAVRSNMLLKQQIKEKRMDLGAVQVPIKEYGSLKEEMKEKNAELAGVKKELFWEKDISKFLAELTRLASDLPIEFISLKPEGLTGQQEDDSLKKGSEKIKFSIVPITVAFKSSYSDTRVFLKRIEAGERFIRVDSLSIESQVEDIQKHLTKIQLSIFIENDA
jgi:hypothetical protein